MKTVQFETICSGILAYLIVLIVFGRKAMKAERLQKRLARINRNENNQEQSQNANLPFSERIIKPLVNKIIGGVANLLPQSSQDLSKIESKLRLAGIYMKPANYKAMVFLVVISCMVIGGYCGYLMNLSQSSIIMLTCCCGLLGFLLNRIRLDSAITSRKETMENQLPEVLDLLSVSMEAGLGFDQALQHVIKHSEGALTDEFAVAMREISLGKPRKDALRMLAERCQIEELKTFVSVVIQADEYGFPLKDILRTQADNVRMAHKQMIEEKSMKMPIKILFPLVLLIFPALFIILLGPAILSIMKMFTES